MTEDRDEERRAFGARVAQLRKRRGLKQDELAEAIGRTASWVSQVERGVQPVQRVGVLRLLADGLGVSVSALYPEGETSDIAGLRNTADEVRSLAQAAGFEEFSAALDRLIPRLEHIAQVAEDMAAFAGTPVISRPERTPGALRDAVAKIVPHRLAELQNDQTRAVAQALEANSLRPLHTFVLKWAVVIEIERFPETARRFHFAERVELASKDPEVRARGRRVSAEILGQAQAALGN
ncbi:helix-turn-helix domain-containing protein [Streptodolium elevatio]|uniref:Helix-turn-helix transcriptional regulator n=1 Tax=Streptodolium elevatio TaxID=3157996 RepID=A0ABV3DBX6_9ACTN